MPQGRWLPLLPPRTLLARTALALARAWARPPLTRWWCWVPAAAGR
jgi:hypothetical protein